MTKGAQHWKQGQLFRCCHLCRKPPTSAGEESIPGWMMTWLYLFLPLSLFIYHMLGHSLQCHQCRMWQCFLGTQITLSTPNLSFPLLLGWDHDFRHFTCTACARDTRSYEKTHDKTALLHMLLTDAEFPEARNGPNPITHCSMWKAGPTSPLYHKIITVLKKIWQNKTLLHVSQAFK